MPSIGTWATGFLALAIFLTFFLIRRLYRHYNPRLYRHYKRKITKEPIVDTSNGELVHASNEAIVDTGNLLLIILAAFGLSAAFSTINEANRSSARQYLSDNSAALAETENTTPEILCIYHWGPATRRLGREGCGDDIFTKNGQLAHTFDNIQLYIEESLLFFIEARQVEMRYGANFYGGFGYWRDDFSMDRTGAISYYILSREVDQTGSLATVRPQSVACLQSLAQIEIRGICTRYVGFMDRLNIPVSDAERQSCPRLDDLRRYEVRSEEQCASSWWLTRFAEGYGSVP